jgi:hypothetical protein
VQDLIDLFHKIYDVQGLVEWGGLIGLVAIVFAETGLLVGFFLPGDSLLVTAGIFCTQYNPTGKPLLNILWVNLFVSLAAIAGDTVGYWIGAKTGPRIFSREDPVLLEEAPACARRPSTRSTGARRSSSPASCPSSAPSPRWSPAWARWSTALPQLQRLRRHLLGAVDDLAGLRPGDKFPASPSTSTS